MQGVPSSGRANSMPPAEAAMPAATSSCRADSNPLSSAASVQGATCSGHSNSRPPEGAAVQGHTHRGCPHSNPLPSAAPMQEHTHRGCSHSMPSANSMSPAEAAMQGAACSGGANSMPCSDPLPPATAPMQGAPRGGGASPLPSMQGANTSPLLPTGSKVPTRHGAAAEEAAVPVAATAEVVEREESCAGAGGPRAPPAQRPPADFNIPQPCIHVNVFARKNKSFCH